MSRSKCALAFLIIFVFAFSIKFDLSIVKLFLLFQDTKVQNIKEYENLRAPHIHKDLFKLNFTLINITDFHFTINNDICNTSSLTLVVLVHSATQNKEARDIIR